MRTGQCYCGTVKYQIEGDLGYIVHCHCRNCRRVTGAAFYSAAFLPEANFSITAGQDEVREYQSPEVSGLARCFCGKCGGRLFVRLPIPGLLNIAITTLDEEPSQDTGVHINVASKAPWDTVADTFPQHAEFPPDMGERLRDLLHNK